MEFGRTQESKHDRSGRVLVLDEVADLVLDEVADELRIEFRSRVNRAEQWASCTTGIVEVPKRRAKVERARACKIDIPRTPGARRPDVPMGSVPAATFGG